MSESPAGDRRKPEDAPLKVEGSDGPRVSLLAALVTLTFAGLVLGAGRWLSPAVFAGSTGFGLLAYGTVLWIFRARGAVWHLSWWMLLAVYLFAAGMAIRAG